MVGCVTCCYILKKKFGIELAIDPPPSHTPILLKIRESGIMGGHRGNERADRREATHAPAFRFPPAAAPFPRLPGPVAGDVREGRSLGRPGRKAHCLGRRAPARSKSCAISKIHATSNIRASPGIFPSPYREAPGVSPDWGAQWGGGLAEAIHLPSFAHSERSDLRF